MKLLKGKVEDIIKYFDNKQEKPTFETLLQSRSIVEVLFMHDIQMRRGLILNSEINKIETNQDTGFKMKECSVVPYLVQIFDESSERKQIQILEVDVKNYDQDLFPLVSRVKWFSEFEEGRKKYIKYKQLYGKFKLSNDNCI